MGQSARHVQPQAGGGEELSAPSAAGRPAEGAAADARATQDARFAEIGRRIFAREADFAAATGTLDRLPAPGPVEIALAGRSNVGKSSLVNALTNRKALARTSITPGRTQELIFFDVAGAFRLVDMPGYGYAEAPKEKVAAWTALIHDYLRGRRELARVYVLVDARHGLKSADLPVLDTLDRAAVSYQTVLTKIDAVKPAALEAARAGLADAVRKRPAAHPEVLATSSRTGEGMADLRSAVARLLAERGVDLGGFAPKGENAAS